jgi:hypothetical protein
MGNGGSGRIYRRRPSHAPGQVLRSIGRRLYRCDHVYGFVFEFFREFSPVFYSGPNATGQPRSFHIYFTNGAQQSVIVVR